MKKLNKLILSLTSFALSIVLITSGILYIAFSDGGALTVKKDQNTQLIDNNAFLSPDNKYRGLQIVHDFSSLSGGSYSEKAQTVINCGWGGVITNDGWTGKYLQSERKLENLNEFVQAVDDAGMRVWLYDEKGYPSGSAGDLTVSANEDYIAVRINQHTVSGKGAGEVSLPLPENFKKLISISLNSGGKYTVVEGKVENDKIVFNGVDGGWTAQVYFVEKHYEVNSYFKTYPNLLNKDAVKKFIEVTHQTYGDSIESFSDIVEAFFTDEPALQATKHYSKSDFTSPVIPYVDGIFESFEEKFGYDLVPKLPLLFYSQTDEAIRVRANFYSHVGDLLAESYFGQIEEWCKEHGVKSSGHLLLEEQMIYHIPIYGDYMQCSIEMGYPGFDILNVRPKNYIESMSTGGKYASSPAWLYGKERVFVEICPVHDPKEFATNHLDYALGTMTFAYFDGGNQVGSYYGRANNEPETGKIFNEYIGRMGSMLVGAQNKNEVAIYYTIDSVGGAYIAPNTQNVYNPDEFAKVNDKLVGEITSELRNNGLDYVFLDDNSLINGTVKDNALEVNNFAFKTIIVPRATVMDISTANAIDKLIQSGVNVVFVGEMPRVAFLEKDQQALKEFSQKYGNKCIASANQIMDFVKVTPELIVDSNGTIFVSPYEKDGVKFFFLANASANDLKSTFNYEGAINYRIYDPLTGEISEVNEYSIPSYRGIFVQPIIEK